MRTESSRLSRSPVRAVTAGVSPAVILAFALIVSWLASFPGSPDRPTRVWRGYDTLLVRGPAAAPARLAHLVKALGPGVVSDLTAPITFWDFTGVASVPLARLDERIDPRDPRHDPVADELAAWFRAPGSRAGSGSDAASGSGAWSVVFVPSNRPSPIQYLRAAAVLGLFSRGWRLVEFDPLQAAVSLAGLLAFALLLAWPGRRDGATRFIVAGAGAALWVPYLLGGGLARLALSLLLMSSWYRAADVLVVLQGWDEKRLREIGAPLAVFLAQAGAAFVVLLPAGGFSAGEIVALCGPVAGSCLLLVAGSLYRGRAPQPRHRRKFEPVPIVRPSALAAPPGQAGFLLAFGALLACALVPLVRSVPVASPVGVLGVRDFSWDSLERLDRTRVAARLPDASDLVTREAWQEALPFGRPWRMPRADERVYVRAFLIDAARGSIVAAPRRVKVFDSAWLASRFSDPPDGSLEKLLVAQRRPMAVGLRSDARELFREAPVALLVLFVLSALLVRERATVSSRSPVSRRALLPLRSLVPLMKSVVVRLNGSARRNQVP